VTTKRKPKAAPLLVEVGTEELPPKALRRLSEAFGRELCARLVKSGLVADAQDARLFATPRRLAVLVHNVLARQPDRAVERRGPAAAAAFEADGRPTRALEGFARSCGVTPDRLQRMATDKGDWMVWRSVEKGRSARVLVPNLVAESLAALPVPKRMRWSDLDAEFVRPVHWLVLLHGTSVIPARLLSVTAGRATHGHRHHQPGAFALSDPARYEGVLERRGKVIADFDRRRSLIASEAERLARSNKGRALIDPALLDEVTGLVEWPRPFVGTFDKAFLEVPQEALISTMRDNQKYFPVVNARGRILPCFIGVANIASRQPRRVVEGNERVLAARFADARFFWETDRAVALDERLAGLKGVVFHVKLGSLHEKVTRVRALAAHIARDLGADPGDADRAAVLCKADLLTGMVGEFPELQGTMGRYYALHQGENAEVAAALQEHYQPRFSGDELPGTVTGRILAVADRLDTLAGIFGAGELPSGDKDPFGLRRAALGVLRILIEQKLDLDLAQLLDNAVRGYDLAFETGGVAEQIQDFMLERLRAYYAEAGIRPDVFDAVLACRPTKPHDFDNRVRAVAAFRRLPAAAVLAAANKRIRNILRQAGDTPATPAGYSPVDAAERELAQALAAAEAEVRPWLAEKRYTEALSRLARLREPVDRFFDEVLVMAEDPSVRAGRLGMLAHMSDLFLEIADISRLQA